MSDDNITKFFKSSVSRSVIAGVFTYKLLSTIIENFIEPLFSLFVPHKWFVSFNRYYDGNVNSLKVNEVSMKDPVKYKFRFGRIFREAVVWCIAMMIIYFLNI